MTEHSHPAAGSARRRFDRRALLTLAGAAVPCAVAGVARAQDAAPVTTPQVTTPQVTTPPAPLVTSPVPPPRPPAPAPAPAAVDRTKAYYVFFDQNIDVNSMRGLRRQLTTLVEAGVGEITIVLHSAGGLIDPMLAAYSFIRALPAKVNVHAQGFVQSAATLLFLAGQERSADRNARFLFHPSQVPLSGSATEQQMQDRLMQFEAIVAVSTEIFHDRTSVPDAQIARFGREQVIFTAEQARSYGIVQTVEDLRIPGDGKAKIVFLD